MVDLILVIVVILLLLLRLKKNRNKTQKRRAKPPGLTAHGPATDGVGGHATLEQQRDKRGQYIVAS